MFIISVVCLLALIGVGIAMIGRLRAGRGRKRSSAPPPPEFKEHLLSAVKYGAARDLRQVHHQRVESITARKEWNAPSQAVEIHPTTEDETARRRNSNTPTNAIGHRQTSGNRIDWTHFNKDYGDLTDPNPSRPAPAASQRAASRRRS